MLDLTRVIAGPVATRTLAAWGAEVLRIDPPHLPEPVSQTVDTLVGKRSALLDAATRDGRGVLDRLLAEADVLVHGYRPGALDRLGLSSEDLAQRHPHLTVVSLTAWGDEGPWARRRGFDSIVQAACGIAVLEGSADTPGALPAQVLDHATGYLAAAAAMLSVAGAGPGQSVGRPQHARLALASTAQWLTSGRIAHVDGTPQDDTDRHADRHRVEVPGPGGAVIAPPGQVDGLPAPAWGRAGTFGADVPAFQPR